MKITSILVDKTKSDEGVWVEYSEGAKIKLAKSENPKHIRAQERFTKKRSWHKTDIEKRQKDLDQALVGTVLLDWKGFEAEDGTDFPFNKENAFFLLQNSPDFRQFVILEASDMANFQEEALAALEGN